MIEEKSNLRKLKKNAKATKSSVQKSAAKKKKYIDEKVGDIMDEIFRLYNDKRAKAYYLGPGPLALKTSGAINAKNIVQSHLFKIKLPKGIIIEILLKDVSEVKKKVEQALKKNRMKVL